MKKLTLLLPLLPLLLVACAKDAQTKPDTNYFPSKTDRSDYIMTVDCKTCVVTQSNAIEYNPVKAPQKINSVGDDMFTVTATTTDTISVIILKDLKYINVKFKGVIKPNTVYNLN